MTQPPKKPRVVAAPPHYLPPVRFDVVQVPRAVWSAAYWDLTYAHLRELAMVKQNGLSIARKDPEHPYAPINTVWLREGPDGQALCYSQQWRD